MIKTTNPAIMKVISMSQKINRIINERADEIGISRSEYIRSLVLKDVGDEKGWKRRKK